MKSLTAAVLFIAVLNLVGVPGSAEENISGSKDPSSDPSSKTQPPTDEPITKDHISQNSLNSIKTYSENTSIVSDHTSQNSLNSTITYSENTNIVSVKSRSILLESSTKPTNTIITTPSEFLDTSADGKYILPTLREKLLVMGAKEKSTVKADDTGNDRTEKPEQQSLMKGKGFVIPVSCIAVVIFLVVSVFLYKMCQKKSQGAESTETKVSAQNKESVKLLSVKSSANDPAVLTQCGLEFRTSPPNTSDSCSKMGTRTHCS